MNLVLDFLSQNGGVIIRIVEIVLLFVIAIVQLVKYGKVSKGVIEDLKYRVEDYRSKLDDGEKSGQVFHNVVPEYAYDENKQELYQIGVKDLQAIIQSSADCALDKVLERFGCLPPELQPVATQSDDVNIVDLRDDLSAMNDFIDDMEDIRSRYNFGSDLSYKDMFSKLEQMKIDFDENLKKSTAMQNNNKEGNNNE